MHIKDRLYGSLLGLAIGDSVGTAVEFKKRDSFAPVTDMTGGGVFNLPAGYWTDDTSMAICLAENIIANNKVEPIDLMERFFRWYQNGENSSTKECFDIGITTISAITNYILTKEVVNNNTPDRAGNGSIMRLAPVAIKYYNDREMAYSEARLQSSTTHASEECMDSSQALTEIILNAFNATNKQDVFLLNSNNYCNSVLNIMQRLDVPREQVSSTGYVIHTLHAALWSFNNTDNFKDAILLATNLGEDADTVAAVTGQIAGAFYGIKNIPTSWLEKLYQKERFIELVDKLINE